MNGLIMRREAVGQVVASRKGYRCLLGTLRFWFIMLGTCQQRTYVNRDGGAICTLDVDDDVLGPPRRGVFYPPRRPRPVLGGSIRRAYGHNATDFAEAWAITDSPAK